MDATYRQRHDESNDDNDTIDQDSLASFQDKLDQSILLTIFLGPPYAVYRKLQAKVEQFESAEGEQRDSKLDVAVAFCFGYARKKKYESRRFPNWDPLPRKLGAWTTTVLIMLFAIVFSDLVLNKILGLDANSTSPMGGVCTDDGMQEKVDTIHSKLLQTSNLAGAIAQTQVTTVFLETLQNDTSLWGETGYECENDPKTKEAFKNSEEYGTTGGFHFFPGVCTAAQAAALEAARNQTCMENFCNFGSIVDPESITPKNGELTGINELNAMLEATRSSAANIKAKCKRCPGNSFGSRAKAGLGMIVGKKPKVYLEGQEELLENVNGLQNGVNNIGITAPTVSYGYMNESFCGEHEILCPDYSKYEELSSIVEDYRLANLENVFDSDVPIPTIEVTEPTIDDAYYEVLELLLLQLEVATYLYTAYKCLSLFFPPPQIVFKVNFKHGIRQYLFGLGKYKFLFTVLFIWWLAQYIQAFPIFVQLEVYMKVLVQEPCVANRDYLANVSGSYSTVCNTLLSKESEWSNNIDTIDTVLGLIPPMEGCCSDYPNVDMRKFTDLYKNNQTEMAEYGLYFDSSIERYLPIENYTFIGNMTACEDYEFVRREVIELSEASEISWWNLWISSGVLASLLLSPVVANYGIGLAYLADPLMHCDGEYEGPPNGFSFEESEIKGLMEEIRTSLMYSAFGQVMISGVLLNLLMFNVIIGKMDDTEGVGIETEDAIVAGVIVTISIITFVIALKADRILSRRIILFEELNSEDEIKELELKSSISQNNDV